MYLGFVWHLIVIIVTLFYRNNHKYINLNFFLEKKQYWRRRFHFEPYKFERVSQGNSCEYRKYKIILDTCLRSFLRWWWKMKWFCCRMCIFSSKYEPRFWEKNDSSAPNMCGAAEHHGNGPQHVDGGLRGYTRDKQGRAMLPNYGDWNSKVSTSVLPHTQRVWITTERATPGTAEKWRNTELFVTTLINWKAPVFIWSGFSSWS